MKSAMMEDGSRYTLVCVDCKSAAAHGADRVDATNPLWRMMWDRQCELNTHALLSDYCPLAHHYDHGGLHVHHATHSFWACDWCGTAAHGRRFCASVLYLTQ